MRADPDSRQYTLDSTLDFLRMLWSIQHSLQRASKRMEKDLGITGPQRLVLRVVGRFPGLSAGDLAHIVRLHPSTITGILQRLADRGLLERRQDEGDRRRAKVKVDTLRREYICSNPRRLSIATSCDDGRIDSKTSQP